VIWPDDVRLDLDTATRDQIIGALLAVGCSRTAAEVLADSLRPSGWSPEVARPGPAPRRGPVTNRCRRHRPSRR
jgi:hypothetical protein